MKIAVTGCQGQLSRSLRERGRGRGLELIMLGRPDFDLDVPESISRAIEATRPDIVVNAAAYTAVDAAEDEPERAFRINGAAAGEVAAAAQAVGARVVHISTDYVFDGTLAEPYGEDAIPSPAGVYGRSKLEGEERVRRNNPEFVIARTAWVYSPFGKNFVRTMMALARDRDEVSVVDDQRGSPTCALDLADGVLALAERWAVGGRQGLGSTYHLAGTGDATWFELAQHVMQECARLNLPSAKVKPVHTADWATKAKRPANSMLDSGRFAAEFGFTMPHWRQSVTKVVERLASESGQSD